MLTKEIIGGIAVVLGLGSNLLYICQVFSRQIKPHLFSWFLWGTLGMISFTAQVSEKAGPGAWALGVSSVCCFIIAAASLRYGEKNITRSDWACLVFGLTAIPVWVMTSNPLWAVVIAAIIDAVAFWPTLRKSWIMPHEEGVTAFSIYGLQMAFAMMALETVNLTTVLYPATITTLNTVVVIGLIYRRRVLAA